MPPYQNLTCEPYPVRPEIEFSLQCEADLIKPVAKLNFDVRLVDGRLVITSLTIDTAPQPNAWPRNAINKKMLTDLPLADLLLGVRDWIVSDGEPNSLISHHRLHHDDWNAHRARYIGLLQDDPADGPPAGRKVKRDDAYFERLATDYVLIFQTFKKNPRAELIKQEKRTESSIATDLAMARKAGWLWPVSQRGARYEVAAGPLLLAKWERDGYPAWHPNAAPTKTNKAKKGSPQ